MVISFVVCCANYELEMQLLPISLVLNTKSIKFSHKLAFFSIFKTLRNSFVGA